MHACYFYLILLTFETRTLKNEGQNEPIWIGVSSENRTSKTEHKNVPISNGLWSPEFEFQAPTVPNRGLPLDYPMRSVFQPPLK